MRLLNAKTLQFQTFYGNKQPSYAVLSHRWEAREEEELRCQDILDGTRKNTAGYSKVKSCCDLALKDNLKYIWVDTCCIDKTNSVELQEAINSMFRWYKNSEVCYAYLSDYTVDEDQGLEEVLFKDSLWFSRGWTLQELIAPAKVVFFSSDWKRIGEKRDETIRNLISSTTGIHTKVLVSGDLEKCSVAERMSWASKRSTTRHEDIAYCLLGIFGVHMSLIYGEGKENAFMRLQKTIMEQSDDHSLFAWKQEGEAAGHGLLASCPKFFAQSSKLIRIDYFEPRSAYGMTNRGLEIQLSLTCTLKGEDHFVTLGCAEPQEGENELHENGESKVHEQRKNVRYDDHDGEDCSSAAFKKKKSKNHQIGIYVALRDDGRFTRVRLDQLVRIDPEVPRQDYKRPTLQKMYFPQEVLEGEPIRENHCFRVVNPKLPTWKGKLSALFVPRIKGKIFASPAKAASVGFTLVANTSPGRRECTLDHTRPEMNERGRIKPIGNIFSNKAGQKLVTDSHVEFDLQRGGRVGVLFEPSKKPFANEPESNILEFIAVIFGVNLDGSIYGDIVGIMKNDFEVIKIELSTGSRARDVDRWKNLWLEKYIREYEIASSTMKIEKEIWDLMFSLRIWKNYVAEELIYQVSLSYRPIKG